MFIASYCSQNTIHRKVTVHQKKKLGFKIFLFFIALIDVLKFSGDSPERWIFSITEYFSLLNTPTDQRLRIVSFNLEGAAAEWFQWMTRNGLITTWTRFEESVKNRFGPSKYEDPKGALSKLLQLGTVEDYQGEFEKLMNQVTGISDSLLISFYISGLKLHLQRELLASKPLTLGYVFLLARMIEARLEDNRSTATIAKPNDLVQAQHLEETTFHKSNKVKETEARVEATVHKENATTEKEETIKETTDTLTPLQSEVASLEAKGSLDANEEIKKDHTLVHELEKQVEKLPMELQLKNNVRGALETKDSLHDLQEVKTKRALKIDDEEFKKAKSEATRKIRKLAKVYDAWLPPWLASCLVVYQPYVKNHWKEFMFIQGRIWDPGIKIYFRHHLEDKVVLKE
ncbi:myosin heavy chain-related protein [Tanacetum coccineum]